MSEPTQAAPDLIHAVLSDDITSVRQVLGRATDPNILDSHGCSALHYAVYAGRIDLVLLLLEAGARPSGLEYPPLEVAASRGDAAIADLLLAYGANVDGGNASATPLLAAAHAGSVEVVHVLLQNGADVNKSNDEGTTPLMWAAGLETPEMFFMLLQAGANPSLETRFGQTARTFAAKAGRTEQLSRLLKTELPLDKQDIEGNSDLTLAADSGQADVVALLLDHGAEIHSVSMRGFTPLMAAAHRQHPAVVRVLLERGAEVNVNTNIGDTPLLLAARGGSDRVCIELLLQHGADRLARNHSGMGVVDFAAANGSTALEMLLRLRDLRSQSLARALAVAALCDNVPATSLLLECGADPNARDRTRLTPLMCAAERGNVEVIDVLLRAGADPNVASWINRKRVTALGMAIAKRRTAAAKRLLKGGARVGCLSKLRSRRARYARSRTARDGA